MRVSDKFIFDGYQESCNRFFKIGKLKKRNKKQGMEDGRVEKSKDIPVVFLKTQ